MPLIEEEEFRRRLSMIARERTPLLSTWSGSLFGTDAGGSGGAVASGRRPLRAREDVLSTRKAVRDFSARAVEIDTVTSVLDLAERTYRAQRLARTRRAVPLTAMVGVRRVTGLPPGLYEGTARGVHDGVSQDEAAPDRWARTYVDAAMYVFVTGPLGRADTRSYGDLLTHAGALGHAVWLAALTHGLECCAFGSADFRLTQEMRRRDTALHHLLTIAVGHGQDGAGTAAGGRA